MVIGNGMIANRFSEYADKNITVFASGVSNSSETDSENFKREETLLKHALKHPTETFIYFSSCDVDNPSVNAKPYYQHKLNMEKIVASSTQSYCIFRLPQVVGMHGNKNTLINFLVDRIENTAPFEIWLGTEKNIIDIEDVYRIVDFIIKNERCSNAVCNIINTKYVSVLDIVNIIEKKLDKKACYVSRSLNTTYHYDSSCMETVLKELDVIFDDEYFERLISKYSLRK
jgi:nucleoside-diphosphate-sugar epimerase